MSAREAEKFEKDPLFDLKICLRKWDEMAKQEKVPIIDLIELKQRAVAVLSRTK